MTDFSIGYIKSFSDCVYPGESFSWIKDQAKNIIEAANIADVPVGVVAGMMAEERKDYLNRKIGNLLTDEYALHKLSPSEQEQFGGIVDAMDVSPDAATVATAMAFLKYISNKDVLRTHDEWVTEIGQVTDLYPDLDFISSNKDKINHPSLIDVGWGNFRITTAVRLLNTTYPDYAHKLGLDIYKNDYQALVRAC